MTMDEVALLGDYVTLPSFTKEQGSTRHLEHVETVEVSEQWVTHLTWLPWTIERADECEQQPRQNFCRLINHHRFGQARLFSSIVLRVGLLGLSKSREHGV